MNTQVAWICRPRGGEERSGDAAVVLRRDEVTTAVLVDALGHGDAAAETAAVACAWLEGSDPRQDAVALVWGMHRALRGTRGAAAMVCRAGAGEVELAGVGNIGVRALGCKVAVMSNPGILGMRCRAVRGLVTPVLAPTRIVLYSDGVSDDIDLEPAAELETHAACRALIGRYGGDQDDASVLTIDLGGPAQGGVIEAPGRASA